MFEEVPQVRRGFGRLAAFRVVLGPFAIGGGVLLATVGGSVAVAATVITASSIATNDVPARPRPVPLVTSAPGQPARPGQLNQPAGKQPGSVPVGSGPVTVIQPNAPVRAPVEPNAAGSLTQRAVSGSPTPSSSSSSGSAAGSPAPSSSGPNGNALIFVTGFDQPTNRVVFQFADVHRGAGPGGSDLYLVSDQASFSASIASGISIVSGGQLCPPAGNSCTVAQLIAAAADGFFADAAIDPGAQLHSIIELDNAAASAQASAQVSPTATQGLLAPAPTRPPGPTATASPSS